MTNLLPEIVPSFTTNSRLLQWNIRGQISNGNMLDIMAKEYHPRAICLQEANVQYSKQSPISIPGFQAYSDPLCKTSIYIEAATHHGHFTYQLLVSTDMEDVKEISMEEMCQYRPQDILYITSIFVKGQVAHYHIKNCYRSPNGNAPSVSAITLANAADIDSIQRLR